MPWGAPSPDYWDGQHDLYDEPSGGHRLVAVVLVAVGGHGDLWWLRLLAQQVATEPTIKDD